MYRLACRMRRRPEGGQGMIEYAFIICLLGLVLILALTVLGRQTTNSLCPVSAGLQNGGTCMLYVANFSGTSVTEYAVGANGNVAPQVTITGLSGPTGLAFDSSGTLYVANNSGGSPAIKEFSAGASGAAAPVRTITLAGSYGVYVDNSGNIYTTETVDSNLAVYPPGSKDPATATYTLTGGVTTGLNWPRGMLVDSAGTLYVANANGNTITEYANGGSPGGNIVPTRTITGLNGPFGIAFDASGNLWVANATGNSIMEFAPGASGAAVPLKTISGGSTGLNAPRSVWFDPSGNIYAANISGNTITEYPPNSNGNVSPSITLSGAATSLSAPAFVVIR